MDASTCTIDGLKLHTDVLPTNLCSELVEFVDASLIAGRAGTLPGKTYTAIAPNFVHRHQSREMLQYVVYTHSNRIEYSALVSPMPPLLLKLIATLRSGGLLLQNGKEIIPDSCVVSSYEPGDWLPYHCDHAGFERPFVIVSLLSAQRFSLRLRSTAGKVSALGGGDATATTVLPAPPPAPAQSASHINAPEALSLILPVGSVLRMGGAAADEYDHAVPAVTERRISITLRRRSSATVQRMELALANRAAARVDRRSRKEARKAEKKALRKAAKLEGRRKRREEQAAAAAAAAGSASGTKSCPLSAALRGELKSDAAVSGGSALMPRIEREHVQAVYDQVAEAWHGTRYKAWPRVEGFVRCQTERSSGALLLDLGCGNGKNLPTVAECGGYGLGLDFSRSLCMIAARRGLQIAVADGVVRLPVRPHSFDAALCIAVLHHISNVKRRQRLVRECMRAVRVGGKALFYAWALEQNAPVTGDGNATGADQGVSGHRFAEQDVLVPYHVKQPCQSRTGGEDCGANGARSVKQGAEGQNSDGVWDTEKQAVVFQRYCHVYTRGELRELFAPLSDWVEVIEEWWDTGNWAVVVRVTKLENNGRAD